MPPLVRGGGKTVGFDGGVVTTLFRIHSETVLTVPPLRPSAIPHSERSRPFPTVEFSERENGTGFGSLPLVREGEVTGGQAGGVIASPCQGRWVGEAEPEG